MKVNDIDFKKDIAPELAKEFEALMNNPGDEKYNLDNKDVEYIKDLGFWAKRAGLKMFIKNAKAEFQKQNSKELVETVEQDLEEDKVSIKDKSELNEMIKNPEQEQWHLEKAMVKHIKSLNEEELKSLKIGLAKHYNIDIETVGEKFIHFFQQLWAKLEPIFSTILKGVGLWGSEMASKAITKKLGDNEMSKILSENTKLLITETTETLTETISKTHSGKREDNENEKDEVKIEQTIEHTQEVKITEVENAGETKEIDTHEN
jgi:hypothetical protein